MRYGTGLWGNVKITASAGSNTPSVAEGGSVTGEAPFGTMDGGNDTFTLLYTPEGGKVRLYLNGQRLKQGIHFTVSDKTISFILSDFIPVANDILQADYTVAVTTVWVHDETPSGLMNGTNTTYTLVNSAIKVFVWLNGQRLKEGVHFTHSGDTIEIIHSDFIPASSDDILTTDYQKLAA